MTSKLPYTPRLPIVDATNPSGICKICDIADWDAPDFRALSGRIMLGDERLLFRHRKLWEFTKLLQTIDRAGLLTDESLALSVAGGHERVLYYLANRLGRMVVTDIYGSGSFAQNEADASFLRDASRFAPYPYRAERLRPLWMNALQLRFPDALFDVSFCLSSVEHFGGVSQAARVVREMARVTRPGGIVFVSTECAINGISWEEAFSPAEIKSLCEAVGLQLLEPVDFRLGRRSLPHLVDLRSGAFDQEPHINLRYFGSVFSSITLAFRKEGTPANRVSPDELDKIIDELTPRMEEEKKKFILPANHPATFKRYTRGLMRRVRQCWM